MQMAELVPASPVQADLRHCGFGSRPPQQSEPSSFTGEGSYLRFEKVHLGNANVCLHYQGRKPARAAAAWACVSSAHVWGIALS